MSKMKLKWERFERFLGWSLQYCDQVDPELYAVVPLEAESGSDPQAALFVDLGEARQCFASRINEILADYAEQGVITYIESGRDCDGVDYWGRKHRGIEPTYEAYLRLCGEIGEWADGPFYLEPCKPSKADKIEYESVDRVMEAFENGHRHVIHSPFPG